MENSFQRKLSSQVEKVMNTIPKQTYNHNRTPAMTDYGTNYLVNGEKIIIPYRVYLLDDLETLNHLSKDEQLIYHCIYSRSCDGFVRQKHIRKILEQDYPNWCAPYIIKLSDEYVVQILDEIYDGLNNHLNPAILDFCIENNSMMKISYQRMVSYWDVYHRHDYPKLKNYIGRKLFVEHYQCNGKG